MVDDRDLPHGVGDRQDPGAYRIVPREYRKFFGFAATTQSTKPAFLPGEEII